MKLIQLEYFETVCNYESINKAAEELHVSQPAVTKAIQQLESEFDVALFHRFNNHISLTEEGEFFLRYTKDITSRLKLLENRMHEISHQKLSIKIGIPPMIGAFMFADIYQKAHLKLPEINLETFEEGSRSLLDSVEDDTLDMAIVISDDALSSQFNTVHLYDTEIMYCTSPLSELSGAHSVTIEEIGNSPIILMKKGSFQNLKISNMFHYHNLKPNVILYSNQLFTIKDFIKNNMASAFLLKDIGTKESDIVSIPFADPLHVQVSLVWKKYTHLPSHALKFVRFMQRYNFGA